MLAHEKLDVYQVAIEFLAYASLLSSELPRGSNYLVDQLRRAALSVPLNIAEATGKPGGQDRKRFYSIARGSAAECGAVLDAAYAMKLIQRDDLSQGKGMLVRLVAMLTKMCR